MRDTAWGLPATGQSRLWLRSPQISALLPGEPSAPVPQDRGSADPHVPSLCPPPLSSLRGDPCPPLSPGLVGKGIVHLRAAPAAPSVLYRGQAGGRQWRRSHCLSVVFLARKVGFVPHFLGLGHFPPLLLLLVLQHVPVPPLLLQFRNPFVGIVAAHVHVCPSPAGLTGDPAPQHGAAPHGSQQRREPRGPSPPRWGPGSHPRGTGSCSGGLKSVLSAGTTC